MTCGKSIRLSDAAFLGSVNPVRARRVALQQCLRLLLHNEQWLFRSTSPCRAIRLAKSSDPGEFQRIRANDPPRLTSGFVLRAMVPCFEKGSQDAWIAIQAERLANSAYNVIESLAKLSNVISREREWRANLQRITSSPHRTYQDPPFAKLIHNA